MLSLRLGFVGGEEEKLRVFFLLEDEKKDVVEGFELGRAGIGLKWVLKTEGTRACRGLVFFNKS